MDSSAACCGVSDVGNGVSRVPLSNYFSCFGDGPQVVLFMSL